MAFWRTKVAISLKRVNMEEKFLWTAYRNSSNALSDGTIPDSPTPWAYGLPFREIWGLQLTCTVVTPSYLRNG